MDITAPYLWSSSDVFSYMNDAYRMFVRLTGGIPDFTSPATEVSIIAGEAVGVLDPSILKINKAQRASDGGEIEIINYTDLGKMAPVTNDYGQPQTLTMDSQPGIVRYGIIGMQRNTVRWVKVPLVDDMANLIIYRLPFGRITDGGQDLTDVDEDHHLSLLDWMKYRAYGKQDADAFDARKSEDYKATFEAYCAFVRSEIERYKSKVRVVGYGGI